MTGDGRHVVLALARGRADWLTEVSRWATSGVLAIDLVKAVSDVEVRSHLDSGRCFTALLVDADVVGLDRDLLGRAMERGCSVLVLDDSPRRDWLALGALAVLPRTLDPVTLGRALDEHARPLDAVRDLPELDPAVPHTGSGRLVAVTGGGGAGRSTVAMAVAQGLPGDVVLVDACLRTGLGVLHDVDDVIPGVPELVEAHRRSAPPADTVRRLTYQVPDRGYRLLLGLRRQRDWTGLRAGAVSAAIAGLRQAFPMVVADVDVDVEGEAETGSMDVEDRNVLARSILGGADVVVVASTAGTAGLHGLLRTTRELRAFGIPDQRLLPVLTRAPRSRRRRSDLVAAATRLAALAHPDGTVLAPVLLPERRQVEESIRDVAPMPPSIVAPITAAVAERLDRLPAHVVGELDLPAPVPIAAGSLGTWHEEPR